MRLLDARFASYRLKVMRLLGERLKAKGDDEKNIDIFVANASNGNVGTRSADIFSTKILVGAFYK